MSYSEKALQEHVFAFGDHDLRVVCRRLPGEVSRVTQTLQIDVEELFASVLDFDIGTPAAAAGAPSASGSAPSDQQSVPFIAPAAAAAVAAGLGQPPDSKKLCGNVASDQPDLIGLDVWPASIALCNYLVLRPQLAAGAAVCELGAGMGLPGLLSAQLGAASVLLTDYEPLVVDQQRQNAALNGLQQRCSFLALDWFDLAPLMPAQRAAHDLLLLADVIYAAAVVGPLVQTLQTLLRPETGVALVAHRIRRPLVFDRVDKIARLEERDEIFEDFKGACGRAGLHLRFLNDDCPAALAGEEPLLLAIGASEKQLQRFSLLNSMSSSSSGGDGGREAGGGGGGEGGGGDGSGTEVLPDAAAAAAASGSL